MIEILTLPAAGGPGAISFAGGVTVARPWGALCLDDMALAPGWYRLSLKAGGGALLQLREQATCQVIELAVTAGTCAYARIEGGTYTPELFAGARPGDYALSGLVLEPLSRLAFYRLLAGRGLGALSAGISLKQLFDLARRSLGSKGAMGVRAAGHAASRLGVLTAADRSAGAVTGAITGAGPRLLVRFADRPMTADDARTHGLDGQSYSNYTLDEATPWDLSVQVGHGQRLTADALAQFAALAAERPEASVLLADAWEDDIPTCRVAFDPLLHAGGYPLPHARRAGVPTGQDWVSQQDRHAIVSLPLASGPAAPSPPPPHIEPSPARPLVSLIIPTRDRADLLRTCLAGLFDETDWPHEVIVVDNGSVEAETKALFEAHAPRGLRVVEADIPFNFSTLCNRGAAQARGDYLVFMNNDVAPVGRDWLARMMELAVLGDVGAVGARLHYPDGRLQHGGVFLGLTQACGHLWRGLPHDAVARIDRLSRNSLRAAVTAALLCVERRKFDAVAGFDEDAFPVTLNDIDLCLRLQARGWFSAFAAGAEAIHAEGESRGTDEDPDKRARRQGELDRFTARWAPFIEADPWLPPAIMRSTEIFNLR